MFLSGNGASAAGSYGLFILETVVALAVIAVAGWAVVRFSGRRLLSGGGHNHRMKLVERLVLEPRRSIYLVEVDGEILLIGTSESAVHLLDKHSERPHTEIAPNPGDKD